MPEGKGPFPAVLLLPGSGPTDRDETIFGRKPFLLLADNFTRHGIAVLRADKRGIGKSTGDANIATLEDLAADAEAGVALLRGRADIDPRRIGLLGHSEGGAVATIAAAAEPRLIDFLVLLAAPGERGQDLIVAQVRALSTAAGGTAASVDANAAQEKQVLALVVSEPASPDLRKKLHDALAADGVPEDRIAASIAMLMLPAYRSLLEYDPAQFLRQVKCPVLALDGSKDLQVPAAENLSGIATALAAGGNHRVKTMELPGLNHLFQPAQTGMPSEYAHIPVTMDPSVPALIREWILAQPPLGVAAQ